MDCAEYIENCLSAYADGELTPSEGRAAEDHLANCPRCRVELANELALKQMLRQSLALCKTPPAVEARIRAALEAAPVDFDARPRKTAARFIRRRFWIPAALAACIVAAIFAWRGLVSPGPEIPLFDQASAELAVSASSLASNISPAKEAAVHDAYQMAGMPSGMWNFTAAGYHLVSGRLAKTPDGERVTYTLYRSATGSPILCMRFNGVKMAAPDGAVMRLGKHLFYRRDGVSYCLTIDPDGHFTCILVSRQPIEPFVHTVELARVDQNF